MPVSENIPSIYRGAGIGAAAGVAAGMIGVLTSRGPDAVLARGSTLEMVLDRPISFKEEELNFGASYQRPRASAAEAQAPEKSRSGLPIPGRR